MAWHTIHDSEHFISSPGQGEDCLQTFCLDTYLSELAKSNPTQEASYLPDSETDTCQSSPSGTMLPRLTESLGADQLMFFAEDSLAKTSLRRVKEQELPESVRDYGRNMHASLERCNLSLSLPKTHLCFALGDLELSSKTWPRWGIMLDGECWELGMSVRHINETECGSWPTPSASDGTHHMKEKWIGGSRRKWENGLRAAPPTEKVTYAYYESGLSLGFFPFASEMMNAWPPGWTDLKPLGTDRFQSWLRQHSLFSQKDSYNAPP